MRLCFERCRQFLLSFNPFKSVIAVKKETLLGFIVLEEGLSIDPKKVEVIQKVPIPLNLKQLSIFVGHVKWHGRHLKYLSDIMAPFTHLIKKDVEIVWGQAHDKAFYILKKMLIVAPIVQPLDWGLPFHIFLDASSIAIEAILMQDKVKRWFTRVYYASRLMTAIEKNYTVTEREALGMIYALNKFRHYLLGNKVVFHVDHQALLYLVNKPCSTGKIVRWFLILLEFDFTVVVKKGTTHQRADHLSWLTHGEPPIGAN